MASPFVPGSIVVLYLREPREKIWGVLQELTPAGVALRGIDLRSFDDWLRDRMTGKEDGISASLAFYPLARVEKMLLDEVSEGLPSLSDQARSRTGVEPAALLSGMAGKMVGG